MNLVLCGWVVDPKWPVNPVLVRYKATNQVRRLNILTLLPRYYYYYYAVEPSKHHVLALLYFALLIHYSKFNKPS